LVAALPKLEEECFFIAPIGADGSNERHRSNGVLKFIVARAAEELDLQAVRGDQIAEPGQITHQTIQYVLGAKAAVADLTGRNPNVYYELAIRHTAKLPTVLICEQGEMLPFDLAQMRTIFFNHTDLDSADRCRIEIVQHLREALDGAVDSPITASVDLQRLQAGDTVDRSVAELVTAVADLQKAVRDIGIDVRGTLQGARRGELRYALLLQHQAQRQRDALEDRLDALIHLAQERKDPELEQQLADALAGLRKSPAVQIAPVQIGPADSERIRIAEELWKSLDAVRVSPGESSGTGDLYTALLRHLTQLSPEP
jgi:hypothetical protein